MSDREAIRLDHVVIERLAFIKYLKQTAHAQSLAPAPLNCASILTMHDAVEMFLLLACETLNAGEKKPDFMKYFDLIEPKIAPEALKQKESMRRLNAARVALKHHGNLPSNHDIEAFRVRVADFFEDNTPLVFGMSIESISLIEFIQPEESRQGLRSAQTKSDAEDFKGAIDDIAVAFARMIRHTDRRGYDKFFGPDLSSMRGGDIGIPDSQVVKALPNLGPYIDALKHSIEATQEAVKMLSYRIDYRKYSRFKSITPQVCISGEKTKILKPHFPRNPNRDEVRFCMEFVIESALSLFAER